MKRFALPLLCLGLMIVGCGKAEMTKAEEKGFKDSIAAGKGEFDINSVPPEHRDRVRAIMESQKAPPAPGK